MGINKGSKAIVDHIDGDGLNNQRSNLRICNKQQNNFNRRPISKSGYKGVSLCKRDNTYVAYIKKGDYRKNLGSFPPTDEGAKLAAKCYDNAAKKLHGQFAYLNFK